MKTMKLQRILGMVMVVTLSAGYASCSSEEDGTPPPLAAPLDEGTFVDERDGQTYGWVRYGRLDWMTDNFRYNLNTPHCSIYLDADEYYNNPSSTRNLAKYGRLYDLQGALDACPEGWRLPTDEDWQQLEQLLGMSAADAQRMGWRGNVGHSMFSTKDAPCPLNLLLGGYYTQNINMARSEWRFMGVYGYYWTSSLDPEKEGQYYLCRKFVYNSSEVCRMSIDPIQIQLNVRYVRDVQ